MTAPKKPGIRDVAQLAGVSPATVSQILNNKLKGSTETRRRVIEAVTELGYAPDPLYRDAVLQRNAGGRVRHQVIAFISLENIHEQAAAADGFYSLILSGIQRGVAKGNYGLLLKPSSVHQDLMPDFVLEKKVDGVLVEGGFNDAWREELTRRIPTCFVFNSFSRTNANSVSPNMAKAIHDSMEYLVDLGHRNLLTLSPARSHHHQALIQGLDQFFSQSNLPRCQHQLEELHGITTPNHDAFLHEYARKIARQIRSKKPGQRPTALFTGDIYALSLLRAFRELGVRVPEEISVVGFDDTLAALYSDPQLTSYRLPLTAIGTTAVEVLLQQIDDPDRPPRHIILDGKLIERASVSTPPQP